MGAVMNVHGRRFALIITLALVLSVGLGFWLAPDSNEARIPVESDPSSGAPRTQLGDDVGHRESRSSSREGRASSPATRTSLRVTDAMTGATIPTAEAFVWPPKFRVTDAASLNDISTRHLADATGTIEFATPLGGSAQLTIHAPGYFATSTTFKGANGEVALKPSKALHVWFANLPADLAARHRFAVRLRYKEMDWPRHDPIRWSNGWFRRTKFARVVDMPPSAKAVLHHTLEVSGYVEVFLDHRQLVAEELVKPSQEKLVIDFANIVRRLRAGFDSSLSLIVRLPPNGLGKFSAYLHDKKGKIPPAGAAQWDGRTPASGAVLTFMDLAPGRYTPRIQYQAHSSRALASVYLDPVDIKGHTEAVREIKAPARLEVVIKRYENPVNPVFRVEGTRGEIVATVAARSSRNHRVSIDMLRPGKYRIFGFDPGDSRRRLRSQATWVTVERPGQDLGLLHFELAPERKLTVIVGTVREMAETLAIYRAPGNALEDQIEIGDGAFERDLKLPQGRYRLIATYPSGRKVEEVIDLHTKGQRVSLK